MRIFKKANRFLVFAAILSSAILLSSCYLQENKVQKTKEEIVIGFSQLGNESTWRARNTQSIREAAVKENYKLLFDDAYQKQENQIKAIRSFIASRVDVIILSPIVEEGWENVLQEARDARIPVILSDRGIKGDPKLYETLVGTDAVAEGRKAAEFLKEKFADKIEPIKIVEIAGTREASSAEGRAQGFREELADDPRFQIVASENGDFMLSKGRQAAKKLDQEINLANVDVLFSHNDDMTLGVLKYLEETNIRPGKDLVLVSVDAQQEVVDLVKEGVVNCSVECNPNSGTKLMSIIRQLLNNEELEKAYYLEETVFSEFSDLAEIKVRGY